MLEPLVMRAATARITDSDLDALEYDCDRIIEAGERLSIYDRRQADLRFHRTLFNAAGNRVLADTIEPLVRKALLITHVTFRKSSVVRSMSEHKAILQSIRRRDAQDACDHLKAHLKSAVRYNLEVWDNREA